MKRRVIVPVTCFWWFAGFLLGTLQACSESSPGGASSAAQTVSTECTVGKFGCFPSNPQAEWDVDGRHMTLLRDFVYVDAKERVWTAPMSSKVDGASIPRAVWSIVGGPFEGKYRNASIVHDTECKAELRPWKEVHRMFYEASRAGGVGWVKGMLMYAAVYNFGPRWSIEKNQAVGGPEEEEDLIRLLAILQEATPTDMQPESVEDLSKLDLQGVSEEKIEEIRTLIDLRRTGVGDGTNRAVLPLGVGSDEDIESALFPSKPGDPVGVPQ